MFEISSSKCVELKYNVTSFENMAENVIKDLKELVAIE
jgi:hypothetical protein